MLQQSASLLLHLALFAASALLVSFIVQAMEAIRLWLLRSPSRQPSVRSSGSSQHHDVLPPKTSIAVIFALLLTPIHGHAQSVTLPPEIKAARLQWIIVAPLKVDGGKVKWRLDPELQEVDLGGLLPADIKDKLLGKVVTYAGNASDIKLKVECWNAKGDVASEIAVCWVVIGKPEPVPPGPTPPNPEPTDPFTQRVVSAFRTEAPTHQAKVKQYAALYAEMSAVLKDIEVKKRLRTVKDVWETVGKARDKVLSDVHVPTGYLRKVGGVIGEEFNVTLATVETTPMTEALFVHFAAEFARVARALEACR